MNDNEWVFSKVGFWGLRRRRLCLGLICHKSKPSSQWWVVEKNLEGSMEREREREVATLRYNLTVPSCIFFF